MCQCYLGLRGQGSNSFWFYTQSPWSIHREHSQQNKELYTYDTVPCKLLISTIIKLEKSLHYSATKLKPLLFAYSSAALPDGA